MELVCLKSLKVLDTGHVKKIIILVEHVRVLIEKLGVIFMCQKIDVGQQFLIRSIIMQSDFVGYVSLIIINSIIFLLIEVLQLQFVRNFTELQSVIDNTSVIENMMWMMSLIIYV
jgi:hypothetical protein